MSSNKFLEERIFNVNQYHKSLQNLCMKYHKIDARQQITVITMFSKEIKLLLAKTLVRKTRQKIFLLILLKLDISFSLDD